MFRIRPALQVLGAAILALAFSGCATPGLDPAARKGVKSIVVVPLMPEELNYTVVGTTAFNNEHFTALRPTFSSKAQIAAAFASELSRAGYSVADPAAGDTAFAGAKFEGGLWTRASIPDLAQRLATLQTAAPCDAVILISTAKVQDPFLGTNQFFSGCGLYRRSFFNHGNSLAFAILTVGVHNAKTGELIGGRTFWSSAALPGVTWHKTIDEFSATEHTEIESGVQSAIVGATRWATSWFGSPGK